MVSMRDSHYDRFNVSASMASSSSDGKTHLVVVQPSSFCNIDCKYCYVPSRSNKSVMPNALVEEILAKVFRSIRLADGFRLVWHNGEPLAIGMDFYRHAHTITKRVNVQNKSFAHCIQTNGTLIDDSWADFFVEYGFYPSVSVDGPRHVHDANRITRSGRGSFDATVRGIRVLRRKGIKLVGLCVISAASLPFGREILNFFIEEGFASLGLIVEEPWSANAKSSLYLNESGNIKERFRQFIEDFYDTWYPYREKLEVREFDDIFSAMRRLKHNKNSCAQQEDTTSCTVVSFDREGDIATFSPQMVTGTPLNPKQFVVANIKEISSLDELPDFELNKRIESEINAGIELCKQDCGYFSFCGGGSPATKFYEHGSFIVSETQECIYRKKMIVDLLLEKVATHQAQNSS